MAYKRRKEIIEKQIKEHKQDKILSKNQANLNKPEQPPSDTCPFSGKSVNPSSNSEEIKPKTSQSETPGLKSNKKFLVSIQTTEEKAKENMLRGFFVEIFIKPFD